LASGTSTPSDALTDLEIKGDTVISTAMKLVLVARRPLKISELGGVLERGVLGQSSNVDAASKLRNGYTKILRINPSDEVSFVHHSLS
jgi:hypothetical protein